MAKLYLEHEAKGVRFELQGKEIEIIDLLVEGLRESKEFQQILSQALYIAAGDELAKMGIDIKDIMNEIYKAMGVKPKTNPTPEPKEPEFDIEQALKEKQEKKKERIVN